MTGMPRVVAEVHGGGGRGVTCVNRGSVRLKLTQSTPPIADTCTPPIRVQCRYAISRYNQSAFYSSIVRDGFTPHNSHCDREEE